MDKDKAIKSDYFGDLDSTISLLYACQSIGKNVYIDFESVHGIVRLYSADIDENDAYIRVTGLTKSQRTSLMKLYSDAVINDNQQLQDEILNIQKELKFKNLEQRKNNATPIENLSSLKDVVELLMKYKKEGINVYLDYNSANNGVVRLYSADITPDDAYLKVTGLTKEQFDTNRAKFRDTYSEENEQVREQLQKDVMREFYEMKEKNKEIIDKKGNKTL